MFEGLEYVAIVKDNNFTEWDILSKHIKTKTLPNYRLILLSTLDTLKIFPQKRSLELNFEAFENLVVSFFSIANDYSVFTIHTKSFSGQKKFFRTIQEKVDEIRTLPFLTEALSDSKANKLIKAIKEIGF